MRRLQDALLSAECLLGEAISDQIARHHRRRLRRIGWERALDAHGTGWATGEPAPRSGNAVEIMIDGADALPIMARELAAARSHIHMTNWFLSPDFELVRGDQPVVLRHLLAELAERVDVRILVWAGAPLPLFRPSRREVREMRDRLTKDTRIQCGLDPKERPMHCHHEKTMVIDDRVAFVGGIDLTWQSGDRFDSVRHPARSAIGWHDAAARIEGPAVADVAEHFRMRWHEVKGERLAPVAPSEPAGDVELQIVRTVPEHIYDAVPHGDFRILESYAQAIRSAQRFIYLENQFLWSPEIARLLRDKLLDPPTPDFRILLVLPSSPKSGNDDTRGVLAELIDADCDNGRILACALYARAGSHADPIYVHAKVAIIDDRWLTLGSANLNEHSLFNDTEVNVVLRDEATVPAVRLQLWAEHLERSVEDVAGDPAALVDEVWRPRAEDELDRRRRDGYVEHRLTLLPHVSRRAQAMWGPISGLLVDG